MSDPNAHEQQRSRPAARWVAIAVIAVALAAAAGWWVTRAPRLPEDHAPPATMTHDTHDAGTAERPETAPRPPAASPPGVRAPARRIAENGRLSVTAESLREGEVLALGLAMPDVARGHGVLDVKIADVSGRSLDVVGEAVDGTGTGMRIEIDPDWLTPGRYLIQVRTTEHTALPLRRYVLEVTPEAGAAGGALP